MCEPCLTVAARPLYPFTPGLGPHVGPGFYPRTSQPSGASSSSREKIRTHSLACISPAVCVFPERDIKTQTSPEIKRQYCFEGLVCVCGGGGQQMVLCCFLCFPRSLCRFSDSYTDGSPAPGGAPVMDSGEKRL